MPSIPFKQVDVFTTVPFEGNPVAVVLDANGLTADAMQSIARWTNLSETTFVLPPTANADYRVRIFTPTSELPFAGHPTIGTAHALLEAGRVRAKSGQLVQECGAGLIRLILGSDDDGTRWIAFELPEPSIERLDAASVTELEAILGTQVLSQHTPRAIDVGPRWVVAQLARAEDVISLKPDLERMARRDRKVGTTGVVVFGEWTGETRASRIEVRAFAPSEGAPEDPVCGSGNGCVAAFIKDTKQSEYFGESYVASQGRCVGRAGMLRVSLSDPVRVAGAAVTCIDGELTVP